ncbi:hypothetical protein V8E54_008330 [Elaphomyces granulatus]
MLIYAFIALLPFLLRYLLIMATWFTVIGRIAQIEGIADSAYKNALVEFEEGDSELSSCRCFYVAFWGDLLESGRDYVIFGTGRLTGNEDCTQPKYRRWQLPVINAFGLTIHKVQGLSLPSFTLALNKSIFSDGQAYVVFTYNITLRRRAPLKSKHPNATALSSLPPLMIPLPPTLPTNHHGSVLRSKAQALLRKFCSKRQFDNEEKLVLWLQDIGLQLHMPTKSTRKRRDVTPVRPRKRKGGLRTD